jgi:hypothetical protein
MKGVGGGGGGGGTTEDAGKIVEFKIGGDAHHMYITTRLSVREYFAAAALSNSAIIVGIDPSYFAERAFQIADCMIEESRIERS